VKGGTETMAEGDTAASDVTTDVCVVGGGPAGLTLALLLLRSGVRVAVIEQRRSLDRDYRGEILQPGGMALLDQLGVLKGARDRGAYELTHFQLVDRGRPVLNIDYRQLPGAYNHLLSIPQRHLLAELLERCQEFDGFSHLDGHRITGLVREKDATGTEVVRGAVCAASSERDQVVRAHCVVGADGRFSKTRRLAGIENHRADGFDLDVLWFKLPNDDRPTGRVRIHRAGGNPVLEYDSHPGAVQIGWTLPHKGYGAVAEQGVERVREQVAQAIPERAAALAEHVRDLKSLTLLDVFSARAERWESDGLVLIGDAAHTHSPLGAQGLNLAIQDAVLLHPVLMRSLGSGDFSAAALSEFSRLRGADIDAVAKMQAMQSKGMFSQGGVAAFIRPKAAKLISRTPIGAKITRKIAYGNASIRVDEALLTHH
jgi:6-methylpretetramide 4-monooxygenase